jgi:RND superfamily putative drug exporter
MECQSGTITTAGLIMTIAFSSLLASSTAVLNQWGFMLVVASLYDTFVVRTLLVPALMFCFVEANWWPGRVPAAWREAEGGAMPHAMPPIVN